MNIKPDGLTIPDCVCFKTKLKAMNRQIDFVSAKLFIDAMIIGEKDLHLCSAAKDYYFAAIIWQMICGCIKKDADDVAILKNGKWRGKSFDHYRLQFEDIYDRLRPLVMQRIDYGDGVLMEIGE